MTKKLLILLVAMTFTLSIASTCLSAGMEKDLKGSVTKIEGNKVTILDSMGSENSIEVNDQAELQDLKVADRVAVKDGMIKKESGGSSNSQPPASKPGPGY